MADIDKIQPRDDISALPPNNSILRPMRGPIAQDFIKPRRQHRPCPKSWHGADIASALLCAISAQQFTPRIYQQTPSLSRLSSEEPLTKEQAMATQCPSIKPTIQAASTYQPSSVGVGESCPRTLVASRMDFQNSSDSQQRAPL